MLEILNDVLAAEKRAEEIIEQARTRANSARSKFAEQESRSVQEAQSQADKKVRERLSAIREEQDRRVGNALEELREAERRFESTGHPRMDDTVKRIVSAIVTGRTESPDKRGSE